MNDIRGPSDENTSFGKFFPGCPSCEVAPMIDGWCHHIDAPQDKCVMQSEHGNRRDYCGYLVQEGLCPLKGDTS